MTIPSLRSMIFEVKSTGSELAFGRLRKTSDFFGNLRKWTCRLQKSQYSQDKNLTLISQKKLAGIFPFLDIVGYLKNTHKNPKFGKVRQVLIRELGREFPGSHLSPSKNGNPLFFPVMCVTCYRLALFQTFIPCFRWFQIVCEWL